MIKTKFLLNVNMGIMKESRVVGSADKIFTLAGKNGFKTLV